MAAAPPSSLEPPSSDGSAFNDVNFSDIILRIEIIPDLAAPEPDSDDSLGDSAGYPKRRRIDHANGDEVAEDNEASSSMEYPGFHHIRTIHISSRILAAGSPFFSKLFSNGTSESKHVTLRIQASGKLTANSKEDDVMDMLNFMYSNALPKITPTALLNVLMAAEKFEVESCMRYCKKFLADRFKCLNEDDEELLNMPLVAIEAILSSDDLKVKSEYSIFEFIVKWAQRHYPDPKERRDILSNRLVGLVRFPSMSARNLKKVLTCSEIESEVATRVVSEALFFQAEAPQDAWSRRRWYNYLPVKVVEFENKCTVHLDIKREECERMYPNGRVHAQFHLGERRFFLFGECRPDVVDPLLRCFGLFLSYPQKGYGGGGFRIDYWFAARMKPSEDFFTKHKGGNKYKERTYIGSRNLFQMKWPEFMADDSPYFINGLLHLKAEFAIKE